MQSRTSYYPIAFSLFAAGLPPEKPLYRKNSRILIEKSLDEDGADAGLGIAGKGLGYYNFGMRYYDPELGIWLTQDMRLQFHSPYAYVANPLIYIDPNGLWSLGIGLVFGYDDQHGWHVGVGVAADFSDEIGIGVNVSYVANEDNSQTATVSAAASIEAAYASAGYQYNTKTGHSLSANIGVSVGVGYEAGTNQFWSTDGSYVGGRIYSKQFIGFRSANIGVVHQEGFGRVSSGFYLEASAMGANWSNDMDGEGWDFTGFEMTVPLAKLMEEPQQETRQNFELPKEDWGIILLLVVMMDTDFLLLWVPQIGRGNYLRCLDGVVEIALAHQEKEFLSRVQMSMHFICIPRD